MTKNDSVVNSAHQIVQIGTNVVELIRNRRQNEKGAESLQNNDNHEDIQRTGIADHLAEERTGRTRYWSRYPESRSP